MELDSVHDCWRVFCLTSGAFCSAEHPQHKALVTNKRPLAFVKSSSFFTTLEVSSVTFHPYFPLILRYIQKYSPSYINLLFSTHLLSTRRLLKMSTDHVDVGSVEKIVELMQLLNCPCPLA